MQETSIDEQMFENSIQLVNTTSGINYSQLADFNHVAFLANTENVDFANSYQISNAGQKVSIFWFYDAPTDYLNRIEVQMSTSMMQTLWIFFLMTTFSKGNVVKFEFTTYTCLLN